MRGLLIVAGSWLCFVVLSAQAGDAVAVGYNAEGVWTVVTYYASSTPQGGTDYKNSAEARETALRDIRRRANEGVTKTGILASSDSTSYAAVARAETNAGKDVLVVGYGKSPAEAEKKATDNLKGHGATSKQKIMYRYFSNGADAAGGH